MNTLYGIQRAIEFNTENGLYQDNPEFIRVYFTYDGGKYNGQRDSIKSLYQLQELKNAIHNGAYNIKDIDIVSTKTALLDLIPQKA